MLPEITDLWMEQVQSQEMAEMLAFNLLQHVDYAPVIAYQWICLLYTSDSKRLKEQMYKDEKVVANTSKKKSLSLIHI